MISLPVENAVIRRTWSGAMPSDVKAPELTLAARKLRVARCPLSDDLLPAAVGVVGGTLCVYVALEFFYLHSLG